jgi:hypothetical protein
LQEVAEARKATDALSPGAQGRSRVALEIVTRTLRSHWSLATGANLAAVRTHGQNALGRSVVVVSFYAARD